MPAVSKAQFRFMQALAHDPALAKEHGMKPSQATEYVKEQKPGKLPEKKKTSAEKRYGSKS